MGKIDVMGLFCKNAIFYTISFLYIYFMKKYVFLQGGERENLFGLDALKKRGVFSCRSLDFYSICYYNSK